MLSNGNSFANGGNYAYADVPRGMSRLIFPVTDFPQEMIGR